MAQSKEAKDGDRGLTWTHQETLALIWVWSDTEIQDEFEKCKRNTTVYEKTTKQQSVVTKELPFSFPAAR